MTPLLLLLCLLSATSSRAILEAEDNTSRSGSDHDFMVTSVEGFGDIKLHPEVSLNFLKTQPGDADMEENVVEFEEEAVEGLLTSSKMEKVEEDPVEKTRTDTNWVHVGLLLE